MTDLRERFGQYREVEVPDLWDRIEELAGSARLEPTPIVRRRPLVVALAAFASVLLVGFVLLILRLDAGPAPSGTEEPAPTTVPSVDDPDGPVSSPGDLLAGWQKAEGVLGGHSLNDLVVGGEGLVAVGMGGANGPGIWTSTDGLDWDMARPPDLPKEDVNGNLSAITAGGPGFVAVGGDIARDGTTATKLVAAVWTSPDGRTWSRVPHTSEFEGSDNTFMWDVTASDDLIVAVGSDLGAERAAVWNSSDGLAWVRVTPEAPVFQDASMLSVTWFGAEFVAVGQVCEGRPCRAAVWVSADGQTWTRSLIDDTHLSAVATWDQGLIALGSHVWTSADASTWTRLPTPDDEPVLGDSLFIDVVDVGAGVLVVGGASAPVGDQNDPNGAGEQFTPVAWFTADGATWTDLSSAFPTDIWLMSTAATASQVFVVTQGCTVSGASKCGLWVWDTPTP